MVGHSWVVDHSELLKVFMNFCKTVLFAAALWGGAVPATATNENPVLLERVLVESAPPQRQFVAPYYSMYFSAKEFGTAKADKQGLKILMRIVPVGEKSVDSNLVNLRIAGEGIDKEIQLDDYWASIPIDDYANSVRANVVADVKPGSIKIVHYVTLEKTPDNNYSASYLKDGCARAISATRAMNLRMRLKLDGKVCRGMTFLLRRTSQPEYSISGAEASIIQPAPNDSDPANVAFSLTFPEGDSWKVFFKGDITAVYPVYAK